MRRTKVGVRAMARLAAATAALVASPAAGQVPPVGSVVIEPQFGVAVPAGRFVTGTVPDDHHGERRMPYVDALEPAFLGGLHLAWLFSIGDGDEDGCCRLGPETGFDYVVCGTVVPVPWGSGEGEHLDAVRLRFLAGARLAGLWHWGWLFGRLAIGPEAASGTSSSGEAEDDVGVLLQVGLGLGLNLVDWLAVSLLADAVATLHGQDEGTDGEVWDRFYFGYCSLEFNAAAGFSLLF